MSDIAKEPKVDSTQGVCAGKFRYTMQGAVGPDCQVNRNFLGLITSDRDAKYTSQMIILQYIMCFGNFLLGWHIV